MALTSTIYKAELSISDMDRHYYATHALTLARHPSETEQRLMMRLLAFALFADERLAFGRGLSDEDEPALWQRDYADQIELWIELGQPDESRIRKACARAQQVVVIGYAGHAFQVWWDKQANALRRYDRLAVLEIAADDVVALEALCTRGMRLQCLIQDGELNLLDGEHTVALRPQFHKGLAETA
ncbi:YaeQ family protein [Oleiagrimonas sp. C23AA]|uniref:YaeQ family protein n=1 Tax=Oleiagrimonas sp. C23AA TaxID=2719047 RepID=UPI00141EECFB|nr:YaeQ family protein [Oleiagrimonas sp. C23AA]NII11225.1 YaeQ family protein [Oleiagrimonas sp. C23AA]